MNKTEIIAVEYGNSVLSESMIFQNGDKDKFRPIVFMIYLIKIENRMILVDAGCETMPGFDMKNFIGPIKALENIGVAKENITDIIITHSHHDHVECVKYFKNAVIYIQKSEYEAAEKYFADCTKIKFFDDTLRISKNITAIKIGGHSKGSCVVEINTENKDFVIVGDECYLRECLDKKIPTGSSCCIEKSREFIEKYSNAKYTTLLCHDK